MSVKIVVMVCAVAVFGCVSPSKKEPGIYIDQKICESIEIVDSLGKTDSRKTCIEEHHYKPYFNEL
jgi:hypothetical protein